MKIARSGRPNIMGTRHAVSATHYLAAQAAFMVLEAGGNAVDAGIAGGITLNVVESHMSGFAGVAPIMIYSAATGDIVTIDGLGTWPKLASCAYFQERGMTVVPEGILQTVVPAAADAWLTALARHGTMSFADVAATAIRLARDGFAVAPEFAARIKMVASDFPLGTAAGDIFQPHGRPPEPGERFVQRDLAGTLQYLVDVEAATHGSREQKIAAARAAFYTGDVAKTICDYHVANGGWLRAEDMAGYRVSIDKPVGIAFRGLEVHACGPWSQGPLLLQTLKLLDRFDLPALGHNSADYLHVIAEVVKLAAADREAFYGDPKFVAVPLQRLLSDDYARERAQRVDRARAHPGMPPAGDLAIGNAASADLAHVGAPDDKGYDTSYLCVVDRDGNAFSATPSDPVMRVAPVIPGTGLIPSPRGIQSRVDPKHPSCIAPGKRPRLTPNPAMVVRPGKAVMPFGTPGGDLQTQAMSQVFLNIFVFGMDPQAAIEAPRVYSQSFPNSFAPHTYQPGNLRIEAGIDAATVDALAAKGHAAERWPDAEWSRTGMCAVLSDQETGVKIGAADPRRTCYALGS